MSEVHHAINQQHDTAFHSNTKQPNKEVLHRSSLTSGDLHPRYKRAGLVRKEHQTCPRAMCVRVGGQEPKMQQITTM